MTTTQPDGQPENTQRSLWALKALQVFAKQCNGPKAVIADMPRGDVEDAIADLITDLMHYAKACGFKAEALNARAITNFKAEA